MIVILTVFERTTVMQTVYTDSLDSLLRTIGKPTEKKHSITSLRYLFLHSLFGNKLKIPHARHKGSVKT